MNVRSNNVNFGSVYAKTSQGVMDLKNKKFFPEGKFEKELIDPSKNIMVLDVKADEFNVKAGKNDWAPSSVMENIKIILTGDHSKSFKDIHPRDKKNSLNQLCENLYKFKGNVKIKELFFEDTVAFLKELKR